ncbi:MAG: hypothetical protein IKV93_03445 [Alphaproteobacteria bacterium]|nr:hypothetical protein [Alphaproteobacteria bacterium]
MRYLLVLLAFLPSFSHANSADLDDALRATYTACIGIDDQLSDMKRLAGINTAVTAVGTVAGAGATATGLAKANKDAKQAQLEKILKELQMAEDARQKTLTDVQMSELEREYQVMDDILLGLENNVVQIKSKTLAQIQELENQSKKLGNWRTGLLAGATATNVAGAVIAGTNRVDADLHTQVADCIKSVNALKNAMLSARMSGVDISEAQTIVDACDDYEYVDLSKIDTRATGALVSSGVGAGTGAIGTIVSAVANTNATRADNTDAGRKREQNLNTTANILSAGTTVAATTATVFNASQISAIKRVASVAEKCTGVLR